MPQRLIIVHSDQANYCTDVRFHFPAMQTHDPQYSSHLVQVRTVPLIKEDVETLKLVDAVVIQRPVAPQWKNVVAYYTHLRQQYNFNIVVEFDDALWHIHDTCDDVMKYIAAGVNYCTVTTKPLKREIESRYNIKTIVVPNGVADSLMHPVKRSKVIFYGGSGGHEGDWSPAWKEAINSLIRDGYEFYCACKPIEGIEGCKTYPWSIACNWGKTQASLNPCISVAPLSPDNVINRYKSNLKYLEAGALEIPFLGTELPVEGPYNGIDAFQQVSYKSDAKTIREAILYCIDHTDEIVAKQNAYLDRKHLRHSDQEFLQMWLNSYLNGTQQQGW